MIYIISFVIFSFINDSVFFSLLLALYSFVLTFFLETIAWLQYKNKLSTLCNILDNSISVLLFCTLIFVILVMPFSIIQKTNINLFKKIVININPKFPNILTSLTFLIYLISYYLRIYKKNKDEFIKQYLQKYGKQPFNKHKNIA